MALSGDQSTNADMKWVRLSWRDYAAAGKLPLG